MSLDSSASGKLAHKKIRPVKVCLGTGWTIAYTYMWTAWFKTFVAFMWMGKFSTFYKYIASLINLNPSDYNYKSNKPECQYSDTHDSLKIWKIIQSNSRLYIKSFYLLSTDT